MPPEFVNVAETEIGCISVVELWLAKVSGEFVVSKEPRTLVRFVAKASCAVFPIKAAISGKILELAVSEAQAWG